MPFTSDQALFDMYARAMDTGAVLYRDAWDAKQPAIFFFYFLAGRVFGFGELAVHPAEAIWLIGHGLLLAIALRQRLGRPWIAGLVPLAAAWFFLTADPYDLTQVEILISPLIVWIAVLFTDKTVRRWPAVVAGLIAGVIGAFKLVDLLIPGAVLLASVVLGIRADGLGSELRRIGWFAVGLAGVAVPLAAWVWSTGTAELVWWTWFQMPTEVLGLADRPLGRLVRSTGGFAVSFAAPLVLAAVYLVRGDWRRDRLSILVMAGVVGAMLATLLQLWWSWHFAVFVFPVVLFGLVEVDAQIERGRRVRPLLMVGLAIALAPVMFLGGVKVVDGISLVGHRDLHQYRLGWAHYRNADAIAHAAPVMAGSRVWVMGDPMVYRLLGASQSIPINGVSIGFWPDRLWEQVADDLSRPGTDAIFINSRHGELLPVRAPWFLDRMAPTYVVTHEDERGMWMVARDG